MNTPSALNVLITGAAGYIGQLLVQQLMKDERIAQVIATDVRQPEHWNELVDTRKCSFVKVDIRDRQQVMACFAQTDRLAERIHVVIHLAAVVTPPKGSGRTLAYEVDVLGTRHMFEACIQYGVDKIILTSSGAAYGYYADNPEWLSEEDAIRGNEIFAYSHHKRLVENMCAMYRESHPKLKQLIFRVGTILGENTKNQITAIFERPFVLGVHGAASPFVFIWDQDVVACLQKGIVDAQAEGIFNLAGSGALSLREIAEKLGKRYVAVPEHIIRRVLRTLERWKVAPYGPEQVIFLKHRPVLDNRKLIEQFGYVPKSSEDTFQLYAKNTKKQGSKKKTLFSRFVRT